MILLIRSKLFPKTNNFQNSRFFQLELQKSIKLPKNLEKRKRNLATFLFNRLLSQSSYFDFFNKEALLCLLFAKKLAGIFKQEKVTIEILFLSLCLTKDTNISVLLKDNGIYSDDLLANYLGYKKKIITSSQGIQSNLSKIVSSFQNTNTKLGKKTFFNNILGLSIIDSNYTFSGFEQDFLAIPFSDEVYDFFETLMKVAKDKYKTPIISPELLFLELLRDNLVENLCIKLKLLSKLSELRYLFLKKLYSEKALLQEKLPRSSHYFFYLFKIASTSNDLEQFITDQTLLEAKVFSLRDFIVKQFVLLNFNIFEEEILKSIFVTSDKRAYKYY